MDQPDLVAVAGHCCRPRDLSGSRPPPNLLRRITEIATVTKLPQATDVVVALVKTLILLVWQRSIDFSVDLVVHSTTMYINQHSDLVGGAVVVRTSALLKELEWWANCLGLSDGAFDSNLTLRGLRIPHARMRQHAENAVEIAALPIEHPVVPMNRAAERAGAVG